MTEETTRNLYILCGPPASGKSGWARNKEEERGATVVSADDFFMKDEIYCFDKYKLSAAHEQCRQRVALMMIFDQPLIIVDNTNSQRIEYLKYLELANTYGYKPRFYDFSDDTVPDEEHVRRSVEVRHNVPLHAIQNIRRRFEHHPYAIYIYPQKIR